jgi:hypothetical protein
MTASPDPDHWPAIASAQTYGLYFGFRTTAPDLLDAMMASLPEGWTYARSPRPDRLHSAVVDLDVVSGEQYELYQDGTPIGRFSELELTLAYLAERLERHIVEHAQTRIFVHAAVLGWKGRAVVVPGSSTSGKTTLAVELVRRGALYLTDEFAVFDRRGRVHPFPKPLSVRNHNGAGPRQLKVEELGGRQGRNALPVGLIAVSPYGALRWRPRTLSPGRALLELLANAPAAQTYPARVVETLERVVLNAVALKGTRGEAGPAADAILRRLDALASTG